MKIACLAALASFRGALWFTALASVATAQTQTWIRQFGTTSGDFATAAAPDGAGGVFVSGYTDGSLGGPNAGSNDIWLAHHDSAGNQTWIRQFGSSDLEYAWAAAPDGTGGVFVSGTTYGNLGGPNAGSSDAWLAHYDGAGNQTWIRQFGTSTDDFAGAVASDGAGGVFVSGSSDGTLGGSSAGATDVLLAHYDGAGNQTWIRQFGTSSHEFATAAAPDGTGGVFVSGYTYGSLGGPNAGSIDVWLAHYDGAGNQTWNRQLGTSGDEFATAAAPDGTGGVFVSGRTDGSLGGPNAGGTDAWLARYDGVGSQTWIRQIGSNDLDYAWAAASDGAGGVIVSGTTYGSLGGPNAGLLDAWLAHYDGAGSQTWIRQLGTVVWDAAVAASPDGAGGVFVSGSTYGSLGGPNAGSDDVWLARYDGLFSTRYCTPSVLNSTGQSGELTATGSNAVVVHSLTVEARRLPMNSFGFFLTSRSRGLATGPGGSQGNLCLGGAIGRYVGPGQIKNSGAAGAFDLVLDLASTPTPTGLVAIQPGETWNFQAWYRDANPGPASNFTDAVSVTFR